MVRGVARVFEGGSKSMETKFTPGPWASGIRPDGTMWLSLGDPRKGPHFQGDISCGKNDLPLITASPDLYEALVAMTR